MTRRERAPSPWPGLKKMIEWERGLGVTVDPNTRFECPGCRLHASWFNTCKNWRLTDTARLRLERCEYAAEHERMCTYWEVAHAKQGTRLRYLGQAFHRDYDPQWAGKDFMPPGWVGEIQKHDYDAYVVVATQEHWVTFGVECFELAGNTPLGPLGGPREHSTDRSRWANTGQWQLESMLCDSMKLRTMLPDANTMERLRLARVDLERWLVEDRAYQKKAQREREERAARGETPRF